ncbi:Nucleotide-binding universal stress protein, UspA family [Noviherbaspirillum humi]|uniref:Nucleotide-binding universal stress protein, UspA family n=1 Tax=Noviherbaspirillum humi TaxID=1688639 RepID=A0A239I6V5_9BURK|nr:universal stress protein [Noviherbaspirillum humi]SNS89355.1 Nucleotide-binding universal stress protein, UspA family [Noviherbaspirillum humi]
MFKTILVPTDGSALSDKAIANAVELARSLGASLVGMSVAEPYPYPHSPRPDGSSLIVSDARSFEEKTAALAQKNVERIAEAAREAKVPCETVVKVSASPYEEIVDVARNAKCDAIVMASHGRTGMSRLLLGSETQKVLAYSTLPVLVVR